ncbi:MAG: hypothetical protein ACRCZF_28215, partial [Gemmataceae bacterium]
KKDTVSIIQSSDIDIFGDEADEISLETSERVRIIGGFGNSTTATSGMKVNVASSSDIDIFGTSKKDTVSIIQSSDIEIFGDDGDDDISIQDANIAEIAGDAGMDAITILGGNGVVAFGGVGKDLFIVDASGVGPGTSIITVGGDDDDRTTVKNSVGFVGYGNTGVDTFLFEGGEIVVGVGGSGNDLFTISGGLGVYASGGRDDDEFDLDGGTEVVASGGLGGDTIRSKDAIVDGVGLGGEGDDTLTGDFAIGGFLGGDGGKDTITLRSGSQVRVSGGAGNDTIRNQSPGDSNEFFGGAGDDRIEMNAGLDGRAFGGVGVDTINMTAGTNNFGIGGEGADVMAVTGGSGNRGYGESGNDSLTISGSTTENATASGGSGNDTLTVVSGQGVHLFGESGSDTIIVRGGTEVYASAGIGDDTLLAEGGNPELYGDDGDDTYRFTAATPPDVRARELLILPKDNLEVPVRGSDTIDLSAYSSATLNLSLPGWNGDINVGRQLVGGGLALTLFGSFENVIGTAGNDILTGSNRNNILRGAGGDDIITGLAGDDTLEGGTGNDSLTGGTGDDTYVWDGSTLNVGNDTVTELNGQGRDTLDFVAFEQGLVLDLNKTTSQALGTGNLTLQSTIGDPAAIEIVLTTKFNDVVIGNDEANRFDFRGGKDWVDGRAGDDIYTVSGANLGLLSFIEAPDTDADVLDFSGLDAPLTLDLGTGYYTLPGVLSLQLLDGIIGTGGGLPVGDGYGYYFQPSMSSLQKTGFENLVGTSFADTLTGNDRDNTISGAGSSDTIRGGLGDDSLVGGLTQVVYLDYTTYPGGNGPDHFYFPSERAAILNRLHEMFEGLDYRFTESRTQAESWTAASGGAYVTLVVNDGPGGGIGGEANEIDFRNLNRRNRGSINVGAILQGEPDSDLEPSSKNFVALTSTIMAHELGHMAGLRHADAFGPIGFGPANQSIADRYLPVYSGLVYGYESGRHIMASPASVGSTIVQAMGPVYFGARESIKLAFNEVGSVVKERNTLPNSHRSFHTAESLGTLPLLPVPNLAPSNAYYAGRTFLVQAQTVVGQLNIADETDIYQFEGKANQILNMELISASLNPRRGEAFDGVLSLYNSQGKLLVTNDDEWEGTRDASILDYRLYESGTYFVTVSEFDYPDVGAQSQGRYELFITQFQAASDSEMVISAPGDILLLGEGTDSAIGSSANDIIRVMAPSIHVNVDGRGGYDVLDLTREPGTPQTSSRIEALRMMNTEPTGMTPIFNVQILEGELFEWDSSTNFTDADLGDGDRLFYTITSNDSNTVASIDSTSGAWSVRPTREGTYTFQVTATDTAGASAIVPYTLTVENVAPWVEIEPIPYPALQGVEHIIRGYVRDAVFEPWTMTMLDPNTNEFVPVPVAADGSFRLAVTPLRSPSESYIFRPNDGGLVNNIGFLFYELPVDDDPTQVEAVFTPSVVFQGQDTVLDMSNLIDPFVDDINSVR